MTAFLSTTSIIQESGTMCSWALCEQRACCGLQIGRAVKFLLSFSWEVKIPTGINPARELQITFFFPPIYFKKFYEEVSFSLCTRSRYRWQTEHKGHSGHSPWFVSAPRRPVVQYITPKPKLSSPLTQLCPLLVTSFSSMQCFCATELSPCWLQTQNSL